MKEFNSLIYIFLCTGIGIIIAIIIGVFNELEMLILSPTVGITKIQTLIIFGFIGLGIVVDAIINR